MTGIQQSGWTQTDRGRHVFEGGSGTATINVTVRTRNYTWGYAPGTGKRIVGRRAVRLFQVLVRPLGGKPKEVGYAGSLREAKGMAAQALAEKGGGR
jgi:hypothetical protein